LAESTYNYGTGESGTSGYSGISGFSGATGNSGISGYSGAEGDTGYSGFSGYSGIDGESGYSGISGWSGAESDSGYSGYSGENGVSGISGYSGFSGISGYSGISGWSGISGFSGISGYSGIDGNDGNTGISGYSGISGHSGISGYSGEIASGGGTTSNLRIHNDVTNWQYNVDVDADWLTALDASGNTILLNSVNVTINLTTVGANGRDAGSEASSTWYYIWVIYNPTTTTIAGLFSTSSTSPTMPSGYTYKKRVGAVYNDGSSNFRAFRQEGQRVQYYQKHQVLTAGSSTATSPWAGINVSAYIPTGICRLGEFAIEAAPAAACSTYGYLGSYFLAGATYLTQLWAYAKYEATFFDYVVDNNSGWAIVYGTNVYYYVNDADIDFDVWVKGFEFPL